MLIHEMKFSLESKDRVAARKGNCFFFFFKKKAASLVSGVL